MFHISDELKKENILEKYIPNYHINFLDAGNVEDTERFHSDLHQIFDMLKYREEKDEMVNIYEITELSLEMLMWKHIRH